MSDIKSHHTKNGFQNKSPLYLSSWSALKFACAKFFCCYPMKPPTGYKDFIDKWWKKASFQGIGNEVFWLGHATTLIRLDGKYIVCDPIFSDRCSPFKWFGPKRVTKPPCTFDELPPIDAITISHNHYDHLDEESVKAIFKRNPSAKIYAPLKVGDTIASWGIPTDSIVEADWWEEVKMGELSLICTPARHWSRRWVGDMNKVLWCGWIIKGSKKFFFPGDTSYSSCFKEIGERYGPIDVAALPIGAYEPRNFLRNQHIDPADAVQIFIDTKCISAIPVHWGTFELSFESLDEPPQVLAECLAINNIPLNNFQPIKIGSSIGF